MRPSKAVVRPTAELNVTCARVHVQCQQNLVTQTLASETLSSYDCRKTSSCTGCVALLQWLAKTPSPSFPCPTPSPLSACCSRCARMETVFGPRRVSCVSATHPPWLPELMPEYRWVQREARPISLRQLTFFGRTLTESRLLDSANYCRLELPTRSYRGALPARTSC